VRLREGKLFCSLKMATVGIAPLPGAVDKLPEEMNDMKIRDDKEMEATVVDGNGTRLATL